MIGIGIGINRHRFAGGYANTLLKAYIARVEAAGGVVESPKCVLNAFKALGAEPIIPIALAATGVGTTSFTANWRSETDAYLYFLDVSLSPTFDTFVLQDQIVFAPSNSYLVTGLTSDTTYYYRVRVSTESIFDANYQAILDYATTQGYTLPSAAQQIKQNQLMLDLKAAGVWSKLDTFTVFATDGDSDFALIDWVRLLDYTAVNSPTFTADEGFQGNGTSSYIDTNFNPRTSGSNYSTTDASVGFWTTLLTHDANYIYGAGSTYFRDLSAILFRSAVNDGDGTNRTSPAGDVNHYHTSRTNGTTKNIFENGVALGPYTVASSSEATNFELLKYISNYSSSKIGLFYCGSNLETEIVDFNNALNTYMSSL